MKLFFSFSNEYVCNFAANQRQSLDHLFPGGYHLKAPKLAHQYKNKKMRYDWQLNNS